MPRYTLLRAGDMVGQWTLLQYIPGRNSNGLRIAALWSCRCSCGKEVEVQANNITGGASRSCGHDTVAKLHAGRDRRHKQRALSLVDGFDAGPLFEHGRILKPPRRRPGTTDHGRIRRQAELRATPPWVDRAAMRSLFKQAEQLTRDTGTMHSVDHLVPLQHPLVCGLHWAGNMQVATLADNMRKGNRDWPDAWEVQDELPLAANDGQARVAA